MRSLLLSLSLPLTLVTTATSQQMRYRDAMFQVDARYDFAFHWATNRHTRRVDQLELDLYQPAGDPASLRPAVVVVHGGAFQTGDKSDFGTQRLAMDLASRGFVTVSINYRLGRQDRGAELADIADATEDFREAVRWLRRNAWWLDVDPERIAGVGNSAGGIVCCQAGYVANGDDGGDVSADVQAIVELWGYLTDLDALDAGEVPVHIVHGTADTAVPFRFSELLEQRAIAMGVPVELQPIPGAGHEPWADYFADFHGQTVGFLYEYLDLGRLAGLEVIADSPLPRQATVQSFGIATDGWVLLVGSRGADLPLEPWGILRLAPASILTLPLRTLTGPSRLASDTLTLDLPPDVTVTTATWQAFHLRADGAPRLLTNHVDTTFR